MDRTRTAMAHLIETYISDEPVTFEDWVDDDGLGNGPFRMRLSIYRKGEKAVFDFTGPTIRRRGRSTFTSTKGSASCSSGST